MMDLLAPKSYVCPNCGRSLRLDDFSDIIECEYCGTRFKNDAKAITRIDCTKYSPNLVRLHHYAQIKEDRFDSNLADNLYSDMNKAIEEAANNIAKQLAPYLTVKICEGFSADPVNSLICAEFSVIVEVPRISSHDSIRLQLNRPNVIISASLREAISNSKK